MNKDGSEINFQTCEEKKGKRRHGGERDGCKQEKNNRRKKWKEEMRNILNEKRRI